MKTAEPTSRYSVSPRSPEMMKYIASFLRWFASDTTHDRLIYMVFGIIILLSASLKS